MDIPQRALPYTPAAFSQRAIIPYTSRLIWLITGDWGVGITLRYC